LWQTDDDDEDESEDYIYFGIQIPSNPAGLDNLVSMMRLMRVYGYSPGKYVKRKI